MTELLLAVITAVIGGAAWFALKRNSNTSKAAQQSTIEPSAPEETAPPSRRYVDPDGPTNRTVTPWVEKPTAPIFRVVYASNIATNNELDVAPSPWGSNRRTFAGIAWPQKNYVQIDFSDIRQALDLQTGEILTPIQFWQAVLIHREEEPPNYVIYASAIGVIGALAEFSQVTRGRYGQHERDATTQALIEIQVTPPPREVWSQLLSFHHSRSTRIPLNDSEVTACHHAARRIVSGTGRKPPDPQALELAGSMFPIYSSSPAAKG